MSTHKLSLNFSESAIDAVFAELDQSHLPGCAVGIAIGGNPVYRKGFGLASLELPVVLSSSIRMRIYSITKHFTCLAYLLLCEDGKARIDDPIGRHLPELHPVARGVTTRQLMTNTSGLRDAHDVLWQFSGTGHNVSVEQLVSLYREVGDVNFSPGTHWTYNNGGFVLLTAAVERVADMSFEDFLRTRIFEPVGMHDTLLRRYDTDFVSNSATMHMTESGGGFERSYLGAVSGEGGIVSTVDDMLRWMAHMDAPTVGSGETWQQMRAPQKLTNGTSTGYGFGLFLGNYRGVDAVHHSGGGMGANSQMIKLPSLGLDIVVLVNRHDANAMILADKILDVLLPRAEPVAEASQASIQGTFRSPSSGRVVQLKAATSDSGWITSGQQVASLDGVEIPMRYDKSCCRLMPAGPLGYITKLSIELRGDRGAPDSLRLTHYGNADELVRQQQPVDPNEDSIGHFRADAVGVQAKIYRTESGRYLDTTGNCGSANFTLECLADGEWRAKSTSSMPWGGILSFDAKRSAFYFSSGRTHKLLFRRQ